MASDLGKLRSNEEVPVDDRTGYALDRTVLANERTYAAWIRTGLTTLAATAVEFISGGLIELFPALAQKG